MSLISRVEVTNYLTEGINPNRRSEVAPEKWSS